MIFSRISLLNITLSNELSNVLSCSAENPATHFAKLQFCDTLPINISN